MNSFSVTTYNPKDVYVTFGGYRIVGWQSISITRDSDIFIDISGIRGKTTRVKSLDTGASIQLTLSMQSPSNDVLSTILMADNEEGTGRLALTIKDKSGSSVFSSDEAYIPGFPSVTYTGQNENRVWRITCQSTSSFYVAGNTRPSSSLFDAALNQVGSFVNNIL